MILLASDVRYIVIHCSATKASADIGAAEIDKWHTAKGWEGIGYHAVIRRSGKLEAGRDLSRTGAHVVGHNHESVGVCLVGGLDNTGKPADNFTPAQWETLAELVRDLSERFPFAAVVGHRDLSPDLNGDGVIQPWEWSKACPCFDAVAWWQRVSK